MEPTEHNQLIASRIRERLDALGKNETSASVEAGLSKSGIRNILEGKSVSPRYKTLNAIARVLETTPEWLTSPDYDAPFVERRPSTDEPVFFDVSSPIPLHESAEGGEGGSLIVDPAPIDWLPRPYVLDGVEHAYAIVIRGTSMVPAFRPGDRAWVNPQLPMIAGEDHIFRHEDRVTGEWRALIKELRDWTRDQWSVAQYNPAKTFELPRPLWRCHRVVGKFARK